MKRVKIINGTYGHKPKGAVSVSPISAGGIVDLPDAEAKRLVNLKVAVYEEKINPVIATDTSEGSLSGVVATPGSDEDGDGASVNPPNGEEDTEGDAGDESHADDDGDGDDEEGIDESEESDIPEYSADMSLDALKEIFKECGLSYRVGMSKAEMVAHLAGHFAADDDGDAPPALGTEDPVT